jgi:hypothetical protein
VSPATGAETRCGVVWPTESGWHLAKLFDADGELRDELYLRVNSADEWSAHRFERRQAATRTRATAPGTAIAERRVVETPLSPWWAWSLLLLSAGALWIERRLFDLG